MLGGFLSFPCNSADRKKFPVTLSCQLLFCSLLEEIPFSVQSEGLKAAQGACLSMQLLLHNYLHYILLFQTGYCETFVQPTLQESVFKEFLHPTTIGESSQILSWGE